MMHLYHVSGWSALRDMVPGCTFVLHPGTQGAEGVGVYFSEGVPRISAAEGAGGQPCAMVAIGVKEERGWWLSKAAKARKFGKPRTWHSDGKCVLATVERTECRDGLLVLHVSWSFGERGKV